MSSTTEPSRPNFPEISGWAQFGRRIVSGITIVAALVGFQLCYGSTFPFLVWIVSLTGLGLVFRHDGWRISKALLTMSAAGLFLWPIDASLNFPVLRGVNSWIPFSPSVTAFPSPAGRCVAYVYDYSFLDPAYEVRFAHGLAFPGNRQWVPQGESVTGRIWARWDAEIFRVDIDGPGTTLIYDARGRTCTLPVGGR